MWDSYNDNYDITQLIIDLKNNDPNFIANYLTYPTIYKKICEKINLPLHIIKLMIVHNNIEVITHITNDYCLCRLFKKSIDPRSGNFINQSDIIRLCLKTNNQEITKMIWNFYEWVLSNTIIYYEHIDIIRNWIENIMTFDEQTQKKEFKSLYNEIIQKDNISLLKIMFEEFHLENKVENSVDEIIFNSCNKHQVLFYLLDYFQYDFSNFNTSMRIMFNLIGSEHHELIKNIWKIHNDKIIRELPDDSIQFDESFNTYIYAQKMVYDVIYTITDTDIMRCILNTKNIELFRMSLDYGFFNVNIPKWYRNILMYSNVEFFELYQQIYPLDTYTDVLDFFWKVHDIKTTKTNKDYNEYNYSDNEYEEDSEDYEYVYQSNSRNIEITRRQQFLKLFIEKFDHTQFTINPDKYSIMVNYILRKNIRIEPIGLDYLKILQLRQDLNNDDFIFDFIKKKLTHSSNYNDEYEENYNDENEELYNLAIDKFYEKTLCEITYLPNKNFIDDIFSKHPNPSEYKNIPNIIINVFKKHKLENIEKITQFFTSHFDICYQEHLIFRTVFQIGPFDHYGWDYNGYEKTDEYLKYCIDWFCSQTEPNYYKINISENYNYVLGHRYGNVSYGKIIN